MATIPELLAAAATWCRSGQLESAERAYRQVLELDPGHAEALTQLGLIAYMSGRVALAVEYLRRAAEARPDDADCRNNLGAALASQGQVREAEAAYREALQLRPDFPMAHNNLANALRKQGRLAEAVMAYQEALRLQPAYAEAHNNLGVALRDLGRLAEAEAACREALRLRPDLVEAHTNLGNALADLGRPAEAEAACREAVRLRPQYAEGHSTLGNALYDQGRWAEAEAACREALRLRPDLAAAYDGLGKSLRAQGRPVEAEAAFRAALRLRPTYAVAHNNLGNALRDLGRLVEAEAAFREALRLRPTYAVAHNNLGRVCHDLERLGEGEAEYREALRLQPGLAPAHTNLGMLLINDGRFAEGWAEYEWRSQALGLAPRGFGRPAWDGEPLPGGALLLYAEQGLGDTLQFVRYVALVKQRAAAVVLECQPALIPLLSRYPGIDRLVGQGSPLPPFDAHAPLVSLPHLLGTTLETVPAAVPYLSADPDLVRRWRDELSSLPGLKVGIAWQGNPNHPEDRRRSFPLAALEPLARLPGVHLIVLQKGYGREQLPAAAGWPLIDLGDRLDEGAGPFMDTAAVLHGLDLVVTCDSALAHLAGALGRPAWMALPSPADWRWLRDREDSPWYPTLRLFRQSRPGDWAGVFDRMADALRERLAGMAAPSAERLNSLGAALLGQGRAGEAEAAFREALRLRPDYAEAHNNFGITLASQRRAEEAEAAFRQALRLRPDFAGAHNNLGNVLREQGRLAESEVACREALRLQPGFAEAHNNLGTALRRQGRLAEAEAALREAVRLRPGYAEAHYNLGNALTEQSRLAEAEAALREAVRLRPGFADAHTFLGTLLLSQERYGEGWAEYEWRFRTSALAPRDFGRPAWDGRPLPGGTVLLWAEQGLGDTFQFVRYAARVRERAGAVVLECPPALVPLLSRCPGIDRLVGWGEPLPAFDAPAALLSLPGLLGTRPADVPAEVPYLFADPALVRLWGERLRPLGGFKVGIAWQGDPAHPAQHRFMPLSAFAPLSAVPGVRLVSLQKGAGREQLGAAGAPAVTELGDGVDEAAGAFMDTAAVLRNLDLVVSADTALAHLAGALGAPTWVALSAAANWRWLHGREDSPWYPSLRLFRQSRPGDWAGVFQRMAAALRERH